jgi:hypothetical protein
MRNIETNSKSKVDDLKEFFKDKPVFTVNDLRKYCQRRETNFNETAFKWRIHDIKKKGLITSVKRGVYSFQSRHAYQPAISSRLKRKYKEIKKAFPYAGICVWETQWLNDLMGHQPGHFMELFEVEKEAAQPVFHFLQQQDKQEKIYFKPTEKEIEQYIASNRQSTIIRSSITQSPTQAQEDICIPKLEKILVDLFSDRSLFIAYQGQELVTIFKNAYRLYPVNISTLFRYAQRRKKKERLRDFILKNEIIPDELLD